MIRNYKNEIEFAEASREHGPWLFRSGEDGMFMPFLVVTNGVYFNDIDNDCYFVSFSELASKYRWQDITTCQIEEIEK